MPIVPESELRRFAVLAGADPRTVRKALLGKRVQPMVLERIARALTAAGEGHRLPRRPQRSTTNAR